MLIALLTGSQILVGYPQYMWFSLLAEISYAAFLLKSRSMPRGPAAICMPPASDCIGCTTPTWPRLIIAKEIGLLLGGVQLLPTLDAWLNSARMSAEGSFAAWGSLHPLNLLQLVAPYLFVGRVIGGNTHEFAPVRWRRAVAAGSLGGVPAMRVRAIWRPWLGPRLVLRRWYCCFRWDSTVFCILC